MMKNKHLLKPMLGSGFAIIGLLIASLAWAAGTPTLERLTSYQSFVIDSEDPSISSNGRYVVYTSYPTGYETVILYDRETSTPSQVAGGRSPVVSADGNFIAFVSSASDLVSNDTNGQDDVFVYNRTTEAISRVSIRSDGAQALGGGSFFPSLSQDGRFVAFESWADNLGGEGSIDIYVHDRWSGATTLASQSTGGAPNYYYARTPSISADGRFVAFRSNAWNLVVGDQNEKWDIFLRDLALQTTVRVSEAWQGGDSDGDSGTPVISADGEYVAYTSSAANLVSGDGNGFSDVFLFDRVNGQTSLVSRRPAGDQGNEASGCNDASFDLHCLGISAHGRYISFPSQATNLISGQKWGYRNIFLFDRQASQTILISREYYSSTWGDDGDDDSDNAALSGDGRWIAFESRAWLMGVEGPGNTDIFVYDQGAGTPDNFAIYLPFIRR